MTRMNSLCVLPPSAIRIISYRSALYGFLLALALMAGRASAVTPWTLLVNTNNIVIATNAPYGAVGDGVTDNAAAIQSAINAAAAGGTTNGLSGGTVDIPGPGIYLCGPLTMQSSVNLQVGAGAILRMLPYGTYPGAPYTSSDTVPDFITGSKLHDIAVSGPGAIDGQGAPWWPGYKTNNRPAMITLSGCNRELVQYITLSNSPEFHIAIGGSAANSTVQGVTVRAPSSSDPATPSHNTDACDVSGSNILVQNCDISNGDDDFSCGGGTHDVLITNNVYGNGHGISIGSYTDSGGVSNITVINCTMNGTANGIRIKSDDGRGGLVQNINYFNISMTNVDFPIQVYSYYLEVGTPGNISPNTAAAEPVAAVTSTTPIYRNITFSNITATSVSGYPIGLIWARTELPATNIVFDRVNVAGDRNFCLYNVSGAQFIDCNLHVSSSATTFALFNGQATITNSAPTNTFFTFNGITTNGYQNSLAFYNAAGSLVNTNLIGGPLTLAASTFTVSNDLSLAPNTLLNFVLGTNPATLAVVGNLTLGGTNNIYAGPGFSAGTYTLMTYTGTLNGNAPALGTVPDGYNYQFDTSTDGVVKLIVSSILPVPPAPANLVAAPTNLLILLDWNAVDGATSYNLKRGTTDSGPYPTIFSGLTATNYADANVTNGVNYYYVVTAVGAGGESTNSLQASAVPLPSNQPANLNAQVNNGQIQLSWPQDHLGWRLQSQTNPLTTGLSSNWFTVPNSTNVNATDIIIDPANGAVFFRIVYP